MTLHTDSSASRLARILPVDGTQGAGLGDAIFSALSQALRDGTFQPGDRLREEEIAEHFSVSRTPVRDALRRMSERRLLEISGGRGMMIRRLTRAEVFELYEMREIMEGTAARFAAKNATSTEITLLTDLQAAFERATNPQDWARINKQFHDTIAGAVRNRFFNSPLEELQDFLALLGSTTFSVTGRAGPAADEHRRVLDAIAARDPDAAEAAARDHIRSALVSRLKMLNDAS